MPRWTLAALSGVLAPLFAWAALALPWRAATLFTALVAGLGVLHATTAVLALAGHRARGRAWRVQSFASLVVLAFLAWQVATAAVYLSALYGGLGSGVAAALALVWTGFAFPLLPLSIWGIAATGGLQRRRGAPVALAIVLAIAAFGWWRAARAGAGMTVPVAEPPLATAWSALSPLAPARPSAPGLVSPEPTRCPAPPGPDRPTAFVTWVDGAAQLRRACLQAGDAAALRARLLQHLALVGGAPAAVDEVIAVATLPALPLALAEGLLLRPALDGACAEGLCLLPWQLVAQSAFTAHAPLADVPDLRFGVDAAALRRQLGVTGDRLPGLIRIETRTTVLDHTGTLHTLRRGAPPDPPLDRDAVAAAVGAAERYIVGAQEPDGRFIYMTAAASGERTMAGFGIPRQAGTTMALCELARGPVEETVRRSLALLAAEPLAGLVPLGPTALTAVAMATCRPRVGAAFDQALADRARVLMQLQRPDGGFHPAFDAGAGAPRPGRARLYAAGQALLALVLVERLAGQGVPLLPPDEVRTAVERAMSHYATDYWPVFLRDFFFLEENWHCLAARAALEHHPHAAYERFCLDYVESRARLVLDERSGVDRALRGGFGFGNVVPPQNTPTAGHGEALAAAISIKDARGLDATEERRTLREILRFLLRAQWRPAHAFASAGPGRVLGGWGESLAAPDIRIDYVQHAWAALGHGAPLLW